MELCKNAKQTGKTCKGGFSREIDCSFSKSKCLRDCSVNCPGFESDTMSRAEIEYSRRVIAAFSPGCCGG